MQMNRLISIKALQICLIAGYTKAHRIIKDINDNTIKNNKELVINVGWAPANKIVKMCPQLEIKELIQIQHAMDLGLVDIPKKEITKREASIINTKILMAIKNEPLAMAQIGLC